MTLESLHDKYNRSNTALYMELEENAPSHIMDFTCDVKLCAKVVCDDRDLVSVTEWGTQIQRQWEALDLRSHYLLPVQFSR